ncbi:hypothetical protein [Priestia megaterium]|uniref:hypothetical protein n=1 Tax=Priestia megaterium TaxID=1404 RepID=UPI0011A40C21|nr:hypothetical protein [Priestia megaterium]
MKKSKYLAGDTLVVRLRKDEDPEILKWAEKQNEIGDAIRYLIEEEIRKNGIKDLSQHIPAKRLKLPKSQNINM